jgi:hypothetical protein
MNDTILLLSFRGATEGPRFLTRARTKWTCGPTANLEKCFEDIRNDINEIST